MLPDIRPKGPVSVGGSDGDASLLYSFEGIHPPVSDRSQIREELLELQKMCKSWISDVLVTYLRGEWNFSL